MVVVRRRSERDKKKESEREREREGEIERERVRKRESEGARDEVEETKGKRNRRHENNYIWTGGPNVVRMVSVTQLIACWWLRPLSAVSSPWFMDTKWTPAGKKASWRSERQQGPFFGSRLRLHVFFSFMPNCFARQLALSSFSLPSPRG